MVMAESERTTRPDSNNTSPTARLQWLRQRREALQDKLIRKNNELKNLCIDEAELTGVLPPEIPLDPGESPPLFRKRIGTSFAYPQNLINKLKTNQVEESALELERQVQSGIAKAAYAIVNDSAESKSVRRKHRQIYQQSQRRLKELETRLNFIRQGYGHLARRSNPPENWQSSSLNSINDDNNSLGKIGSKHRTKKPRPPLDSTSDKEISTKNVEKGTILQETEVNLPPGTSFDFYRTKPRYMKHPSCSPVDHNENPDHSIFPDHYRTRTYSHGNIEDPNDIRHIRKSHFDEKSYRNVPSMYNLDAESRMTESQNWQQKKYLETGYNQGHRQQQQQQQQIDQYNKQSQIKSQRFYYQDRLSPLEKTSVQPYNEALEQINPRNSMPHYRYTHSRVQETHIHHGNMENHKESTISRQENEIPRRIINETVMTTHRHKMTSPNDNWTPHVDEVPWYPERENHSQQETFGSLDRRKHVLHQSMKETHSPPMRYPVNPQQHRLEQLPPPPPPPPPPHTRILLRTQSLGSVETWHSGAAALPGTIESPTGSCRDQYGLRGPREKEWYETSMDYGYQVPPPTLERTLSMQRTNHISHPRSSPSPSSISSSPKPPPTPPLPTSSPSFNEIATKIPSKSEKDLEIPAESSNHAGKYREVSKPFLMSDFYKYSTKFRNKQEQVATTPRILEHQVNLNGNNNNNNNNTNFTNHNVPDVVRRPPIPSNYIPVQRRAFEAQMIPGQPYPPPVRTDVDIRNWDNQESCSTPSNDSTVV